MRRTAICCAVSLLMIAAVGRAATLGPSMPASTVNSTLRIARLQNRQRIARPRGGGTARRAAIRDARRHPRGHHRATTARQRAAGDTVLFGDQTINHTVARTSPGRAEAFPFAVQRAGTVAAISIYVGAHNKAKKLMVAVYSNRSGGPVRRVSSGTLSSPRPGSWNTVSVTRATIRSLSTYWIAVAGRGGALYFRDQRKGSCHGETDRYSHLASLPPLWISDTSLDACPISAYATGHPTTSASNTGPTFGTLTPADPTGPTASTSPATLAPPDPTLPVVPDLLPPVNIRAPAITGNPVEKNMVTTSTGSWTGSPSSYAYQWQDCNTSGASCTNISGATSSTYTLQASDVGSTIRSLITATNAGGSTSANSAATSTVTTTAPANTTAPAVTGQTVQGQALTTNNGSWTGSPSSYAYQWQDCNTTGASCTNISGATSSTYTLQASDVGSTIRSLVTATNAGGSTSANSAATGAVSSGASSQVHVGAPSPAGVSCTQTLSPGANVQSAVSSASAGSTVCLSSGSWSAITLTSIAPASPGVTLAARPGQTVVVPGFTVTGSGTRNLTIEGFDIDVPGNTGDAQGGNESDGFQLLCGMSGVSLEYNTIEDQPNGDGVYVFPGNCGSGQTQSGITVEYNQIDHVSTGLEVDSNAAGSEQNFTFSHNVVGPYLLDGTSGAPYHAERGHYIQAASSGTPTSADISGLTIDNNAFEGPPDSSVLSCDPDGSESHLNVAHIEGGETDVTFNNNILWYTDTCGDAVLIQDSPLDDVTVDNNLDVEDPGCPTATPYPCNSIFALIEAPHGLTFNNNTAVDAALGAASLGGTCGDCYSNPNNMTAENNIAAPDPLTGYFNYGQWHCDTSCATQDNISADNSANTVLGGTGNTVNWTPTWTTTNWTPASGPGYQPPPTGYYQPTSPATTNAGYQGQIGP
jgi:hypothetical protein